MTVMKLSKAAEIPSSRWLKLARSLAMLFILFCTGLFLFAMLNYSSFSNQHPEQFTAYNWSSEDIDQFFNPIGLSFAGWKQYQLILAILNAAVFTVIGIFLILRKSQDWFTLCVGVVLVMFGTLSTYTTTIINGLYPAWYPLVQTLGVSSWASFFILIFYFPDGRLVPGWTRWAVIALVVGFGIDLIVYQGMSPPVPLMLTMFIFIGIGAGSQVYRYRRVSTALQRQQTKWVMLAVVVIFLALSVSLLPIIYPSLVDPDTGWAAVIAIALPFLTTLIIFFPVAISFAMLRYRLWDVDLLIRRTLVYGLLSTSLLALYFGSVIVLQGIFNRIGGQRTPAAIVLSTLAIAILFSPLQKRIKDVIDRRFFRRRYNAEYTMESFASKMRGEVDLEQLSSHILGVMAETMQPKELSLWLKAPERRSHGPAL